MANSGLTSLNLQNAQKQGIGAGLSFGPSGQVQSPQQTQQAITAGLSPTTGQRAAPPAHPAAGSLPSDTPVQSHTVTTNPDGSVNSKVTYAAPEQNPPTQPLAQQTIQPAQQPAPQTTFGGLVGSAASTAQIVPEATRQAQAGLLGTAATNIGASGPAYDEYQSAVNDLATLKSQYATAVAGLGGAGLPFAVRQGQEAALQQQYNDQLDAAQQKVNEKAAALGYQIQGTTAQQAGFQQAGALGVSEQQAALGGLGTALGAAKPELGAIGQVPFSPTDLSQGSPLGAPGGTAADAARVAGQFQGAQAAAAAPGQAQAQNIQTQGTAAVGSVGQGLAQSIQQYQTLNTQSTQAQSLATQLQKALENSGLDMTNSTDANTAINNLQSRLGNTAYTQLNIAVNDARNAYAAILQATGATPTDAGNAANQNINANMSPQQILGAIDQLNQGLYARQQAQYQQMQNYQSLLQGGTGQGGTVGTSAGTRGGTVQTKYGAINTNW